MVTARCYIVFATLMNIWMDDYIADASFPCLCLCIDEMAIVLVNTQVSGIYCSGRVCKILSD